MNWKITMATFITLLVAELGDKTQLAVITMTADSRRPLSVFIGAAAALVLVTAAGVLLGVAGLRVVPEAIVRKVAAAAFIIVGILMFAGKL